MKKLLSICLKGFLVLIASLFLMQGVARAHLYGVSYGDPNFDVNNTGWTGACALSRLYQIDPNTALWTGVGDLIKGAGTSTVTGYWGVEGIDFDPNDGKLYGVGYKCSDPNGNAPYLLNINPCTGAVTTDQSISTSALTDFRQFTDISFKDDGTLYAFYLYGNADPNSHGHLAKLTLGGTASKVGTTGTGNTDLRAGAMSFIYGAADPNSLYEADTARTTWSATLNKLNVSTGGISGATGLSFASPILTADEPTIYCMDSQPGSGVLYAAVHLESYTSIGAGDDWVCGNYLATVSTSGTVSVIGCLYGDFYPEINWSTGYWQSSDYHSIRGIAFAPLPRADAGVDFSVQQSSWDGGVVTLDGSGSKDYINCCGIDMAYTWSYTDADSVVQALYGKMPTDTLALGAYEITLTVDNCNGTASDTVTVTVQDSMEPVVTCLPDIVVEQATQAGTLLDPNKPSVSDNCDSSPTVTGVADPNHSLPYVFPLGRSIVIWTAVDASSNTSTCTQSVTVVDTIPPTINSVTATPSSLTPSVIGGYREVTIQVDANDICDSAPTSKITGVTSNQESSWCNIFGDPEWFFTGANTVYLRAKNDLFSVGNRIYTITVESLDASGNSATSSVTVEVKYDWDYSWTPFLDPNIWSTSRDRSFRDRDRRLPRRSRR